MDKPTFSHTPSLQRHGPGSMVYEDKSSYTGDWVMGLRHGQGELVMADGSVYRGQWVNDKPHGKGTLSISTSDYTYNGEGVCCEGVYGVKVCMV